MQTHFQVVFAVGWRLLSKNLSIPAVVGSWVLGLLSLLAFGTTAYLVVCFYFIIGMLRNENVRYAMHCDAITSFAPIQNIGSAVTKLKLKQKTAEGIAEGGGRYAGERIAMLQVSFVYKPLSHSL